MTADRLFDFYLRSLACAVARGRTINAWIGHIARTELGACECSQPAEIAELVNFYHLEAGRKIIDEIIFPAAESMGIEVADYLQAGNAGASLEDAKALIEKCVVLSMQLDQAEKLESLAERVRSLEEGRDCDIKDIWRNSEN
jgi:hypothetical protein